MTIRRSNGRSQKLEVWPVGGGERVRELPDGVLLPDKSTILTLDRTAGVGLALTAVDRKTGATLRSLPLNGSWVFRYTMSGPGILSPDGRWLALVGSTYNSTNDSGQWFAHSEFAVVDTALTTPPRKVALDGSYYLDSMSDDGRSLYLVENKPVARPGSSVPMYTPQVLRIYDLEKGMLTDPAGDPLQMNGYLTDPVLVGGGSSRYVYRLMASGQDSLSLRRTDLDGRTARVLRLETVSPPTDLPSDVPPGELSMLWSMLATRDGRTLYAVNGALGIVYEVDTATFTVRRTGKVSAAETGQPIVAAARGSAFASTSPLLSLRSVVSALMRWIAPVAEAKMMIHSGAAMSSDERTLYAVAVDGLRAIDLGSLKWRSFVRQGRFMDLTLSPDGKRVYALNAGRPWLSAFDAWTGELLGQLDVGGYPQAIVAIDPS